MKKQLYQTPTTDVLVVRFEGVVCASVDPSQVYHQGGAGVYESDDFNDNGDF